MHATEILLAACMTAHPDHAPMLDAIFCVAGSKGLRDLVRLYGAHVLEHVTAGTAVSFPDILAFVNLHERMVQGVDGELHEQRYEV